MMSFKDIFDLQGLNHSLYIFFVLQIMLKDSVVAALEVVSLM